jgi:hypothetical protein
VDLLLAVAMNGAISFFAPARCLFSGANHEEEKPLLIGAFLEV